jgi:glycosyltransferase involved in cell wall biosynthesis
VHPNSQYLAVFHPYVATAANLSNNDEEYALYYGQLSVEENRAAAVFLLEVFKDLDYQLVIVGRKADQDLINKMEHQSNVNFIDDASDKELEGLIQKAKVCCLPSRQNTGIKLKWIQALFSAGEIMVSPEMMADENFQNDCIIANDIDDWQKKLDKVFLENNSADYSNRKELASKLFDNREGAMILKEWCAQVR